MPTITNSMTEVDAYNIFLNHPRQRVSDGKMMEVLKNEEPIDYNLILVLPQLGDFDSLEYAWWLNRKNNDDHWFKRKSLKVVIKAIAIGDLDSGKKFCEYTKFNPENLFIDRDASIHQKLRLYQGLTWKLPFFSRTQNAWFNLLLMCAGIGSKGTLREVFRGYLGDRKAPQLFSSDEQIEIKPFPVIKGSLFNTVGKNYQRPFELATLRLQNMIEVFQNWSTYVSDERYLTQRGGTFLFDGQGKLIYQHRDQGILGFAENMSNPFSFLDRYIN